MNLLVISDPAAKHLRLLERLPKDVSVLIGNDLDFLKVHAPDADVILSDIMGGSLETAFTLATGVQWVHSLAAGVDKILFPGLIASPVPLTNSRGVFKDALAEFCMSAILFFAKDLRRLVRSQEAGRWDPFDNVMVRGQVLGIVGYGEIGRATAGLARALGMHVVATRRRASELEDGVRMYAPGELHEMLCVCDYVVVSAPLTPETRGMIGAAELEAMKRSAVLINIGRGPVVVESALIAALETKCIHGAAIDVFDKEPLTGGHPFYGLQNLLLSPHCADHAEGWTEWAMQTFLENFDRFRAGQPLRNLVQKEAGY